MSTHEEQFGALGFTWDWDPAWGSVPEAGNGRLYSFEEATPRYVHNITAANGNPITLPEIHIMQSAMTVGGRRLEDHEEVVNLLKAFGYVRRRSDRDPKGTQAFTVDRKIVSIIHEIALRHEDADPGKFRGEGHSGVTMTFQVGSAFCPTQSDDGGEELRQEFAVAREFLNAMVDPIEKALAYYCLGVRNRFFLDGNKRAALLTANGLLLQAGRAVVTVEPSGLTALNEIIREFLYEGDATPVMAALAAHIDTESSGKGRTLQKQRAARRAKALLAREGA
ncbi:Fic family protein [Pseudarthrobacter sp. MM222]|uniref:Fic family protein n=1 Tax=Pseudarthrobacter sp. MM222 TaxID=3018929 RepID=UPI002220BD49|nr:Fic family protein [Pseudarthrobacter sp. MM222]CAI3793998.1 hypothetical protein NKCBBBOE_00948 [Pseudarthrobacter sp. MM222]